MKIAVVGMGFVGATVAAGFAEKGHGVVGIENNPEKYDSLKQGKIPFFEPGLPELFRRNIAEGRLRIEKETAEGVKDPDLEAILIAVGTPPLPDGRPDLRYVEKAAVEIAKSLNHYAVIVEKSTVPVRTGDWLRTIMQKYVKCDFDVAACPEFLRESTAVSDFFNPDRIVIGTDSRKAFEVLSELYRSLGAVPIIPMSIEEAEITKHVSNAMLFQRIAVAQTISQLADALGFDYGHVMKGVGLDKRIGPDFLDAGLVGGFCFPKDREAFVSILNSANVYAGLFESVGEVNEIQKQCVVDKILRMFASGEEDEFMQEFEPSLAGRRIGALGLSFKANTSDVRLSPAIDILANLHRRGATISAYDPKAMDEAVRLGETEKQYEFLQDVCYCISPYAVAEQSEVLAILTEWKEFADLDLSRIRKSIRQIVDARNIFDPARMKQLGFIYDSMGRPLQALQ
jgi:UDPglucose 6-dehydrogenase